MSEFRPSRSALLTIAIGALAAVVVLIFWLTRSWEWAWMDDPGFALQMRDMWSAHGLGAPFAMYAEMVRTDVQWGLFRPAYWAYPALVYSLPIGMAHAVRLGMLALIVLLPLVTLRRRGVSWATVALGAALTLIGALWLYDGLVLISVQEVSGGALVAVGVFATRPSWRTISWLLAAWFKSPFAWLLIGEAAMQWRAGERRRAVVNAVLGFGTLVAAWAFARNGEYTAERSTFDYGFVWRMSQNVLKLPAFDIALLLAVVVWWLLWTGTRLKPSGVAVAVGIGWLGYTAQMLPWGVTGYYRGPIAYLLALFLLLSLESPPGDASRLRTVTAWGVPVLVGVLVLGSNVIRVMQWNDMWLGVRECVTRFDAPRVLLSADYGPEAAVRLQQDAEIADPAWAGTVEMAQSGDVSAQAWDLFVGLEGFSNADGPPGSRLLCSTSGARVYTPGPTAPGG